jgi:hypothetical protein
MIEKLIIHNRDGSTTEVEPLKMWDPRDDPEPSTPPEPIDLFALTNANFAMPNDPIRHHPTAPYVHATKRIAEESKARRKMAAKSRKINRRK